MPPQVGDRPQSEADFWIDHDNLQAIEEELGRIEQSLANAHDQSGLSQVRTDYGFDGTGQTVAIIDSGIAYDHFALGGGFGANYRVVGGWDFTDENDADPYDDGTAGAHGTHVAGIVGANGGTHDGVAPGVDLVGLRVFNDAGDGYFSWVENALTWIHNNRNSFENPITAINLSLGVASWNSDAIPSWANLEDEFSLLEQDGIFISVSAGNSFTSYNQPGLSYPAASPHVVPVASVDDSGLLSYYSQRNSRVIAAPGRGIISTVPDYAGDNNGTTDDYASFSGTSMAAPYVAGASVIIREAMEFVGTANITQQTIYDHMNATADSFFDSETNANYNRLNLESAIDAIMPTDDYGSTVGSAYDLGTLDSDESMSGVITTLDDVDYFSFTTANDATVTFTISNMTHDLAADWDVSGGTGVWSGANNEILTIEVLAGQQYSVGFSSQDGLGYYDLDITSEDAFTYTDWGTITSADIQGASVSGEDWYRVSAGANGYLSTQAMFNAGGGQISLELYNSGLQLIDTGNAVGGESQVDFYANANDEFFVRAIGTNADVDFRITNLVSLDQTWVMV
ncbi:MAG: S8 family peptidase, partial [Bythopirellula sp.]